MFRKRIIIIGLLLYALALPSWAGNVDAIQSLWGSTLVAGKSTTLRVYLDNPAANVDKAVVTFVRPDGKRKVLTLTTNDTLRLVGFGAGEASVAVTIPGSELPYVGDYFFQVTLSYNGVPVQSGVADRVQLLPTRDLRLGVDRTYSGFAAKPGELEVRLPALLQMSKTWPVRDGIAPLDQDYTSGIRYVLNDNPQPTDAQLCPFLSTYANKTVGDHIDRGLTYRFPNDDGSDGGGGGNADPSHNCNGLRWATIVLPQGLIATAFAHETGHMFGLPDQFDQWNPDNDVRFGYNVGANQLWSSQVQNEMYYAATWGEYAFKKTDWETLRQQLLTLNSTGPSGPLWDFNVVNTQSFAHVSVVTEPDGRRLLFMLDGSGAMFTQKETQPGNGLFGTAESLGGWALQGPIVPVLEADGRITVFARGGDNHVYYRSQFAVNGGWNGWARLTVNPVTGFAIARNADGRLEAFMVENGALIRSAQVAPGLGFGASTSLGGSGLSGVVAADSNADGRLQVFVAGGDGNVYSQWQTAVGSASYSGWRYYGDPSTPAVRELHTGRMADGRLLLFMLKGADRSIAYRAQVGPNGGWAAPVQLYGHDLRDGFRVAQTNGRLALFAAGGDLHIYTIYQADPARPDVWSNWTDTVHLGTRMDVSTLSNGNVDIYSVDTNGQISQGRVR